MVASKECLESRVIASFGEKLQTNTRGSLPLGSETEKMVVRRKERV